MYTVVILFGMALFASSLLWEWTGAHINDADRGRLFTFGERFVKWQRVAGLVLTTIGFAGFAIMNSVGVIPAF
jgi:hypothetical protein